MATPHVSGFAALLMQQGITNPAAIEAAMKQFATDKGVAGRDDSFGYGLINPARRCAGWALPNSAATITRHLAPAFIAIALFTRRASRLHMRSQSLGRDRRARRRPGA